MSYLLFIIFEKTRTGIGLFVKEWYVDPIMLIIYFCYGETIMTFPIIYWSFRFENQLYFRIPIWMIAFKEFSLLNCYLLLFSDLLVQFNLYKRVNSLGDF